MRCRGKILFTGPVLACLLCPPIALPAVNLINGNRITLQADHMPIHALLQEFGRAGVTVRIDPRVQAVVTTNVQARELDQVLKEILNDSEYVLVWDVLAGPVGAIPRLKEIQVFPRGVTRQLTTLSVPPPQITKPATTNRTWSLYVRDEVLLRLKPAVRAEDFKLLLQRIGGTAVDSFPALGIYRIRLPEGTDLAALLEQLAQDPLVAVAEPNYAFQPPAMPRRDLKESSLALPDLPADLVATGAAPIAILDTGLATNAGLGSAVLAGFDSLDPARPLSDSQGHGTQMAYITSGAIVPEGIQHLANDIVPVIPVRAFDENGYATSMNLIRSVDFAVAQGARVISMSWGSEAQSQFLEEILAGANDRDVVLVAAAGNQPTGRPVYPAAYDHVVAVGAVTLDGAAWELSNYGGFVDLAAPGLAAMPIGYQGPPGEYAGTSISAAFVANTLARYRTLHPTASAEEAVTALKQSLTHPAASSNRSIGSGILDQAAVLRLMK